ncbi:MAG: carbamoyltransferase [Acidobacteriota bacterium]|nr:carbamoyltransferase [Blastocatellia bacterium]MDW8169309.1 carbamoyltransferase [Acidobacteriota bacterium]MDW8257762.1 carbamoyltransferase [Acidobacteriota bacterium]
MYILGLATMGEAAAALLRDGELIAAVEEERFSRIKHHVGFPHQALRYVLEEARINMADVAHVGLYWRPWVLGHRIRTTLAALTRSPDHFIRRVVRGREQISGHYFPMMRLPRLLREEYGGGDFRFHYLEHHLCHAASAFFCSPFESAAIFTFDGTGEATTTLFAHGQGTRIRKLKEIRLPHSLGQFYSAITNFLGFDMFEGDEYKVMGAAAYGEPEFYDFFRQNVLRLTGEAEFQLNTALLDHHLAKRYQFPESLTRVLGPPRRPDEPFTQRHFNIAASAQKVFEETVLHLLRWLKRVTGERALCLAGGCALNAVLNGRIERESEFEAVYIQPAAHDAGGALGAALYIYHAILGRPRHFVMEHAYWGPQFERADYLRALSATSLQWEELEEETLLRRVAQLLAEGKIIAWFQGRMEWGPRALGNRSILADPRRPEIREVINHKVKLREPFRPFAPSVLEERVEAVFGRRLHAPFMITVHPVVPEMRSVIPAVVHVDGTARPQTVSRKANPRYWELIREFERLTGVPVLLNTSFNIQEPIVCTPEDAVDCFLRSEMDFLVLDRFLVRRR